MEDRIDKFEIRAPKALFGVITFLTVEVLVCMIGITIIYFASEWIDDIVLYCILGMCLLLLTFLGMLYYIYFKEVFYFKNEVFTYIKPFKKAQSVAVEDLAFVTIKLRTISKVVFTDKNGNIAMNFLDDGTSFRSGEFINALIQREIEIKYI